MSKIMRAIGVTKMFMKIHAPEILLGFGITATVGAVGYACTASYDYARRTREFERCVYTLEANMKAS